MSDFIGHECGLAMVRLRQPLSYYRERYGDPAMGPASALSADGEAAQPRAGRRGPRGREVRHAGRREVHAPRAVDEAQRARADLRRGDAGHPGPRARTPGRSDGRSRRSSSKCEFVGESSTSATCATARTPATALVNCHPLVRKNNTASRNLAIAGNFNMTNSAELFRAARRVRPEPRGRFGHAGGPGAPRATSSIESTSHLHAVIRARARSAGSTGRQPSPTEISRELEPGAGAPSKAAQAWGRRLHCSSASRRQRGRVRLPRSGRHSARRTSTSTTRSWRSPRSERRCRASSTSTPEQRGIGGSGDTRWSSRPDGHDLARAPSPCRSRCASARSSASTSAAATTREIYASARRSGRLDRPAGASRVDRPTTSTTPSSASSRTRPRPPTSA